ncbi:MAG: MFS transporter [Pseudomonadota bacterium]|nr:MFS transporter [Pseudomonadota bacterium]
MVDFCIFGGAHALLPIIPLFVYSIEASDIKVGIVAGVFMGVAVVLRPFTGWITDAYGRKPILILSVILFALAGLGLPLWPAIIPIILFRGLQGIGWSAVVTASTTLQADVIPFGRRGEGMGYVSSVRNLSTAIAPAVALFIASQFGIKNAIWFVVIISFVGASTVFLVSEVYKRPKSFPPFRWSGLIERSAVAPALVAAAMMFVFGGFVTFIPLDAQRRNIGDPAVFFIVFSLILMVVRPLAGKWSDLISNRGAIVVPGLLMIVGSVIVLSSTETYWTLIIVAALWGFGFGCVQPIIRTLVIERINPDRWGAANATMLTLMDLGLALGPPFLGYVATHWNYKVMYMLSSFPLLICIATMLVGIFRPWKVHK